MSDYYFINYLRLWEAPKLSKLAGSMLQREVSEVIDRHPFIFIKEQLKDNVNVVIRNFQPITEEEYKCYIEVTGEKIKLN
jgi:hypothetical protein